MENKHHKGYKLVAFALFFFLFSFYLASAVSLTELETTTLTNARGTASLTFNPEGTKLFAIDNYHGAKPNFISQYGLNTAFNLSTLYYFNSTNLSVFLPDIPCNGPGNFTANYSNYWIMTSYITRDGNDLYIVVAVNGNVEQNDFGYHTRDTGIIHFTMNSFDLSTLAYSDNYYMPGGVGSLFPGSDGTYYTSPNVRGVYVSDDGSYLVISGVWYSYTPPINSQYPRFFSFNMTTPYSTIGMTNISNYIGSQPFAFGRLGYSSYASYYNLWVSPDNNIMAMIERDVRQGAYSTYISVRTTNNGSEQLIQNENREGMTITSSFGNTYLFNQNGGTLYKYSLNDINLADNLTIIITPGQEVIMGVTSGLIGLFPDYRALTLGQRLGIVFIVLLFTALIILFASAQLSRDGLHSLVIYIILILLVIEFLFFTAISYIPLSWIITLILGALTLSYFRLRSGGS